MSSKTADMLALFLAELLGTALLLFLGCMGCLTWGKESSTLQVTLSFGMVVMIIIQIFGCVSGAHLNPVVSIAAVVYGIINAQVSGSEETSQCRRYLWNKLLFALDRRDVLRGTNAGRLCGLRSAKSGHTARNLRSIQWHGNRCVLNGAASCAE